MLQQNGIIRSRAYARAGLVGNPSDGYFGKTLSFTFDRFYAETVLYESPYIELLPNRRDRTLYTNLETLDENISACGYYGGIRLLQASLRQFHRYCEQNHFDLGGRYFSIRYFSNIPHHVGMAGSSAIITACFRGLMAFYGLEIPAPQLANIILSVEKDELGIGAGLQDRVAQVYQGLTYMDFNRTSMENTGAGVYESLDPALLPNLYIAYKRELSEGSEVFHNNIRARYAMGDPQVVDAMQAWADLAEQVKAALLAGRKAEIGPLLDANFDLRRSIYKIHPDNLAMVAAARCVGASAKFTGSGGAIVGTYSDEPMYERLTQALEPLGIAVLKPSLI
jgi:glucuronokinase